MIKEEKIIKHKGKMYKVIEVINNSKSKEEIEFEQWSDEKFCLKAVEQNGYALQYVKEQSEVICLKAVEEDGDALKYVEEKKVFLKILKSKD